MGGGTELRPWCIWQFVTGRSSASQRDFFVPAMPSYGLADSEGKCLLFSIRSVSIRLRATHAPPSNRASRFPGNTDDSGCLFYIQACEETKFDDAGALRGSAPSKVVRASSRATSSLERCQPRSMARSRLTTGALPPRFPAKRRRARSRNICRIIVAVKAKKCALWTRIHLVDIH